MGERGKGRNGRGKEDREASKRERERERTSQRVSVLYVEARSLHKVEENATNSQVVCVREKKMAGGGKKTEKITAVFPRRKHQILAELSI